MKLNMKPTAWIKTLAASASVFTMITSPVAMGAQQEASQKQMMNQFLKESGVLTKNQTVGEYWSKVRHVYPQDLRAQMDTWVSRNRNQMMPKIEASTFKGADGKDQVRLLVTKDKQSLTLTFIGDDDKFAQANGVVYSKNDFIKYQNLAAKFAKNDPVSKKALKTGQQRGIGKNFMLSPKEFYKLTARQKAEYLVRMRMAMEAADRVHKAFGTKQTASNDFETKYQWALELILGAQAEAAGLSGRQCIIAGYVSVYGDKSCGGSSAGRQDLAKQVANSPGSCSGGQTKCNPLVYGFNTSGKAFCVPPAKVLQATETCNALSPLSTEPRQLAADKKRIIESYLKYLSGKDISVKLNDEGKIEEKDYAQEIKDYIASMQQFVGSAAENCDSGELAKAAKSMKDQAEACANLRIRAISLDSFAVAPTPGPLPPLPPPEGNGKDCDVEVAGSYRSDDGKSCVCPPGTKKGKQEVPVAPQPTSDKGVATLDLTSDRSNTVVACVVADDEMITDVELPDNKVVKTLPEKETCGFWCKNSSWIIPVGILALLGGGAWWLLSSKSKANNSTPTYVPPVAPPGTLPPTTVTPPVTAPDPAPCVSPNVMVAGVCTAPVITGPPTAPSSEGGTDVYTPVTGGTR